MNIDSPVTSRRISSYHAAVRMTFGFLKRASRLEQSLTSAIPLPAGQGALIAISDLHADDGSLISTLSAWRCANQAAYPTRFPVTDAGTADWLRRRLLDVEDRILFLVLDRHGNRMGHLGFANCLNDECIMEVDNVVRGVPSKAPGLMQAALNTLIDWARTAINVDEFSLRVFEDNEHACRFYERTGFKRVERIPLRRTVSGETEHFAPLVVGDNCPADTCFIRMQWQPPAPDSQRMVLTAGPSVGEREAVYAWDAARTGWNSKWNGYLTAFEERFAQYIGVRYCLTTSSCTGALHIALAALDIGAGDEVIVPDITWVATANAVRYVGATPVFADIEVDSWCLDPATFESKITPNTKAVIPVHLYGHPARMDRIEAIARNRGLYIVEDAAPAIGTEWQGRRIGTFGDFACFSFQGAKLLVTGEGGALVTDDPKLYEKALKIWDQGRDPRKTFWIDGEGLKYKMSNIQAALALAQVERCDQQIEMKRRIFEWYRAGLEGCQHLRMMAEVEGARSIYWMSNAILAANVPITRENLRAELKKRNIDTRPVFPPISQYPIWKTKNAVHSRALQVGSQGLNLPSGVCLTKPEVDHVVRSIQHVLNTSPA